MLVEYVYSLARVGDRGNVLLLNVQAEPPQRSYRRGSFRRAKRMKQEMRILEKASERDEPPAIVLINVRTCRHAAEANPPEPSKCT